MQLLGSQNDMATIRLLHLTKSAGVELPALKPNHTVAYQFDANAPMEKGDYVMTWKVEGGLCYPYVAIHVGKPGDP